MSETLRPLTLEEDAVYLRCLMAAVPAMVTASNLDNCIAGTCYDSHDHTLEMRKVSAFSHQLAGYLLDDWRQVRDLPAVETEDTVQLRKKGRQRKTTTKR